MGCSRCASLDGRGFEGERIHACVWQSPSPVRLKLTTLSIANVLLEVSSEKGHRQPEIKLVSFIPNPYHHCVPNAYPVPATALRGGYKDE